MSGIEPLFMDFIYTLSALALAFTGYNVYDRYMDRQDKKDVMRSIADAHNTALTSMMGIHSLSKTKEAIDSSEGKGKEEGKSNISVEVHAHKDDDAKPSNNVNVQNK